MARRVRLAQDRALAVLATLNANENLEKMPLAHGHGEDESAGRRRRAAKFGRYWKIAPGLRVQIQVGSVTPTRTRKAPS